MLLMHKLVFVAQTGAARFYVLLALSVYSVGVVIERWWYFASDVWNDRDQHCLASDCGRGRGAQVSWGMRAVEADPWRALRVLRRRSRFLQGS